MRGLADILQTIREIRGLPVLSSMVLLAGAASLFVGNSYQAQMPGFAHDLGHGDPGLAYTSLLGADAAGALLAGLLLESRGSPFAMTSKVALRLASCWAAALLAFALCPWYALALALLFLAGFFELSFSSLAQTLVQMHAPEDKRGRVLGLFGMSASGLRTFSGLSVGLAGSLTSIHLSLALSAGLFIGVTVFLQQLRTETAPGCELANTDICHASFCRSPPAYTLGNNRDRELQGAWSKDLESTPRLPLLRPKRSRLKRGLLIGALCLGAVGAAAWGLGLGHAAGGAVSRKAGGRGAEAAPVTVAAVRTLDVPIEIRAFGTVEASSTVDVVPQVTGLITQVHFTEGSFVQQGDLLFSVDTRSYKASLAAAQAELARNAALAAQAQSEAVRYAELVRQGVATDQQLTQAQSAAATARAQVQEGQAQIQSASLNVKFTRITAPISGKTGSLLVHAGNVIQANAPQPLVVIRSLSPVQVRFAVPQTYLTEIRQSFGHRPAAREGHTARRRRRDRRGPADVHGEHGRPQHRAPWHSRRRSPTRGSSSGRAPRSRCASKWASIGRRWSCPAEAVRDSQQGQLRVRDR